MVQFVGECVTPVYRLGKTKVWCTKNKGKTFLELMTMSTFSWCLTLLAEGVDKVVGNGSQVRDE